MKGGEAAVGACLPSGITVHGLCAVRGSSQTDGQAARPASRQGCTAAMLMALLTSHVGSRPPLLPVQRERRARRGRPEVHARPRRGQQEAAGRWPVRGLSESNGFGGLQQGGWARWCHRGHAGRSCPGPITRTLLPSCHAWVIAPTAGAGRSCRPACHPPRWGAGRVGGQLACNCPTLRVPCQLPCRRL